MNHNTAIAQTDETIFVPYSNPTFGIRIQYPGDWGRLDLSFLQNDSADINFYPLDDPSGSLSVRIQVNSLLRSQNMTLDRYTSMKINHRPRSNHRIKFNHTCKSARPCNCNWQFCIENDASVGAKRREFSPFYIRQKKKISKVTCLLLRK